MKKIILAILVCIGTIVFLLGFVDRDYNDVIESTADITYSIDSIPKNFKSVGELSKRQQDIVCATSKGLIEIDRNGEIAPALAKSVDIKDEGIEYNFKFRDDIFWSDGTKITPNDYLIFLREVISEETNNKALLNIFGVTEYLNSNKSFGQTVGISATDKNLVIRLNAPDDNFLNELSKVQYRLRKNILFWEDIDKNYSKVVYSGNYYIKSVQNEQIILERSLKSSVSIPKTIHLVKDEDEDLALAAFEVGKRDIVINPPKSQLERLKMSGEIITLPSDKATYLAFNYINGDMTVENKQIAYRLISKATTDYENLSDALVDASEYSYFRDSSNDLTELQSRNVMVNTEYEEVAKPLEYITIVAEETLENKEYLSFLDTWFDNNTEIGLSIELLSKEEFYSTESEYKYDMKLVEVVANLENDSNFINIMSEYVDEKYKKKLNQATNKEERELIFSQIENNLFDEYKIMPLIFYNENIALNSKVKNVTLDSNGNIDFNNIEK